jgi:DNA-binding CsgD family transcriptional regulator
MTINVGDVFPGLTQRQREVCALLVQGLPDKLIARKLGINYRTANHYRCDILQLARVSNTVGLLYKVVGSPEIAA